METVTPQNSAPEPKAENQMEYEGGGQEGEIEENKDRAPSTQQHVQNEGDQSDVEEEGRGKEQVVTEVCFEENTQSAVIQRTRMLHNPPNPSVQKTEFGQKRIATT